MERVIKISTIVLALFFANTSFATIYPIVNTNKTMTLNIDLNDWASTDVNIIIRDQYGEILHNDKFAKGSSKGRKYNLKNLPEGNYQLVIEGTNKKAINTITVNKGTIAVNSDDTTIVYKPHFKVKNNSVELNHLALGEKVTVSFIDEKGVFFTKVYEGKQTINASFDVKDLPYGDYVVALSSANQYASFAFEK